MRTWIAAAVVALSALAAKAESPLEIAPAPAGVEVRVGAWRAVGSRVSVDRAGRTMVVRGGTGPASLFRERKGQPPEVIRASTIVLDLAQNTVHADGVRGVARK